MPWQSALDGLQYYFLMLDRTEVFPPMQVLSAFPAVAPGSPAWFPVQHQHLRSRWTPSPGLRAEAGQTSVPALQDHHGRLDGCSREADGPVSTVGAGLTVIQRFQTSDRNIRKCFCSGTHAQNYQ